VARNWNIVFCFPVNWRSPELSESRADLTFQHDFPLSWNTKVPWGKKMYNHLIRQYHNAYAQWSRVRFPYLKDRKIDRHFSGFVKNEGKWCYFLPSCLFEDLVRMLSFRRCYQPFSEEFAALESAYHLSSTLPGSYDLQGKPTMLIHSCFPLPLGVPWELGQG